jgi:hypothetical protein
LKLCPHYFISSRKRNYCDEDRIVDYQVLCIIHHFKSVKKIVGGKESACREIRLLQPDIIICNKEENTLEIVAELQKISVWVINIDQ